MASICTSTGTLIASPVSERMTTLVAAACAPSKLLSTVNVNLIASLFSRVPLAGLILSQSTSLLAVKPVLEDVLLTNNVAVFRSNGIPIKSGLATKLTVSGVNATSKIFSPDVAATRNSTGVNPSLVARNAYSKLPAISLTSIT